jgi:hypoxanthine phosphoribosyltransferase
MADPTYRKEEFKKLSWDDYGRTLESLYRKVERYLKENGEEPDAVVPILRGGAVPGQYLAYRLRLLTILPVQYKYLVINGEGKLRKLSGLDAKPLKGVKRPVFLLVENNHCFGTTAQVAVDDIRKAFPKSIIIYAAARADYTYRKLKSVDAQFYGELTNEAKGLTPAEARRKGITNTISIFPWETLDEELKAVNNKEYGYRDLARMKKYSSDAKSK